MTDTFTQPMPALAPPTPGELLSQMKPQPDPEPEVTAKDRLLVGSGLLGTAKTAPAPGAYGAPAAVKQQNINLAARKAQYVEKAADPDPDAVWRKLEGNPELVRDRAGKLFRRLAAGGKLPEADWDELRATVGSVAVATEQVGDDLTVGAGKVSSVYTPPDGVWMTVDFPKTGNSADLPGSLTGAPSRSLPQTTLDWPAAKDGISAFAGPADVVYAAVPDEQTDFQLRNLRPGPLGSDGIPRWVAVRPLPVRSHNVLESAAADAEGAVIDGYPGRDAYPGTKGGDWIVWDVPADARGWKQPVWMGGRAKRVQGGVVSSQPEYALTPVTREELPDPQTAQSRLEDTAWAVFEAQGDPQSTSHLVSRLKRDGFDPIEVSQESGRKAWLVFGVDPVKAHAMSPKRTVWTNGGASREDDDRTFRISTAGGTVSFQPEGSMSAAAITRTQRRMDRWAFQVDPDQSRRLAGFATNLEAIGSQNVSIYSREAEIEGFEPAREYLYSDGVSTKVVRTASKRVGDSNAIPVHVRSTRGWPKDRPTVDVDARGIEPKIEAGEDLEQAVQDAAVAAAAYGADKVRVNGPKGRLSLYTN